MRYLIIVVFFVVGASELKADIYLDLGITAMIRDKYSYKQHDGGKINPPMGQIELGYEFKSITVYIQHTSDMKTTKDSGLNLIGVKVRVF